MTDDLTLLEKAALVSGDSTFETRGNARAGIRPFFLSDGPHGVRRQMGASDHLGIAGSEKATCFPTASALASSWDPDLVADVAEALASEATALGVDVVLGPGMNIKRSPLCGRNFEYFSEDPYLTGRMAGAYVRGLQAEGVAACPKHFAVNSQETRRMTNDSVVDERSMREIYLTGFEMMVREAAPWAIMSSYNRINGTYAHEHPFLLQQVLREEWGFDGAVVSDWGGSNDAVAAIRAGGSLEMPSPGFDSVRQIVEAVERGDLDEADLTARADEVAVLAARTRSPRGAVVDHDVHHALARRAASASAVLLRNEDGLLPLKNGTRIAVIGDLAETPRYQGAGSSLVNPTRLTSPLQALRDSDLDVVAYAPGYRRGKGAIPDLLAEAADAIEDVDAVVLYLGLEEVNESEGLDRDHLRIPDSQITLLTHLSALHDRVVVVLCAGSVVEMPWLERCTALVHAHLAGQAGAEALVDVLTGAANPSGRLAETYPIDLESAPTSGLGPIDGPTSEYRDGVFVGYRYYATAGAPVRFPFGFGLSYTTFEYADLQATASGVEFRMTNTGSVSGAEVPQLYVTKAGVSSVVRPLIELKGFAKVHLEAGETRKVAINFDEYTFRHFSPTTGQWEIQSGEWTVHVGANAAEMRLTGSVEVTGTAGGSAVEPALEAATFCPDYVTGRISGVNDAQWAVVLGRPVPSTAPQAGPLDITDDLASMARARNPLARGYAHLLARLIRRSHARGTPNLNLLFQARMPFRAIAKMTNGMVSIDMTRALVRVVDGHAFAGIAELVRATRAHRASTRRLRAELSRLTTPEPRS